MRKWFLALGAMAVLAAGANQADASHGVFALGINIGGPVYRPYPCYGPYYYRPYYPVYVAPAPVYVAPAPIVVQQPAPVYTQPVAAQPVPVVTRANSSGHEEAAPQPRPYEVNTAAGNRYMQQLFDQEERVLEELRRALHQRRRGGHLHRRGRGDMAAGAPDGGGLDPGRLHRRRRRPPPGTEERPPPDHPHRLQHRPEHALPRAVIRIF